MSNHMLHPEAFNRVPVLGARYQELLTERVEEVARDTAGTVDPSVSILIRTRNHADRIEGLLEDIHHQAFSGEVQLVVVDTESTDDTVDIVRQHGATVIPIRQATFNYANSLNVGFIAAEHPFVVTLVGHSRLSNNHTLRSVARWAGLPDFGGAYGAALPDTNATMGDVAISLLQRNAARLVPAEVLSEWRPGAMVAHRSAVATAAWKELRGYDESYGNGGEDTDFARRMIAAGMAVVREPALSVHHSYGLNLLDTMHRIQTLRSGRSAIPQQFDPRTVRHLQTGQRS